MFGTRVEAEEFIEKSNRTDAQETAFKKRKVVKQSAKKVVSQTATTVKTENSNDLRAR